MLHFGTLTTLSCVLAIAITSHGAPSASLPTAAVVSGAVVQEMPYVLAVDDFRLLYLTFQDFTDIVGDIVSLPTYLSSIQERLCIPILGNLLPDSVLYSRSLSTPTSNIRELRNFTNAFEHIVYTASSPQLQLLRDHITDIHSINDDRKIVQVALQDTYDSFRVLRQSINVFKTNADKFNANPEICAEIEHLAADLRDLQSIVTSSITDLMSFLNALVSFS